MGIKGKYKPQSLVLESAEYIETATKTKIGDLSVMLKPGRYIFDAMIYLGTDLANNVRVGFAGAEGSGSWLGQVFSGTYGAAANLNTTNSMIVGGSFGPDPDMEAPNVATTGGNIFTAKGQFTLTEPTEFAFYASSANGTNETVVDGGSFIVIARTK